jgi:hypothetical protein
MRQLRHEKPTDNDLSNQNIRDRFYGRNDPVARKILGGFASQQGLAPPEDQTIVCLVFTSALEVNVSHIPVWADLLIRYPTPVYYDGTVPAYCSFVFYSFNTASLSKVDCAR